MTSRPGKWEDQCVLLHVHERVHTLAPMNAELMSYPEAEHHMVALASIQTAFKMLNGAKLVSKLVQIIFIWLGPFFPQHFSVPKYVL